MREKILLGIVFIFLFCPVGHAACIGETAVWGTADDGYSCARKKELKAEERRLDMQEKERELALKRQNIRYDGTGAGTGNNNVILGGISDMLNGSKKELEAEVIQTRHQVRVELMPYFIPGAYQFDDPGMPDGVFFNGASWEYYINKNLAFGFLWQKWSKSGSRTFDPIMNTFNVAPADETADYQSRATIFPGAIDRIVTTHYFPYVSMNTQIGSPIWNGVFRVGIGRTSSEIKYKSIDKAAHPFAQQPADVTYIDNASLMFDIAVERWTKGAKVGGALRYINARNDTANYNDYINLGSAQIVFYVQFMITPLGLL